MVSDTIDPQLNIYLKTVFTLFTLYFPFFLQLHHIKICWKRSYNIKWIHYANVHSQRIFCWFKINSSRVHVQAKTSCFRSLPPPFKMVVLMIWTSFVRYRATTKNMFNESKKINIFSNAVVLTLFIVSKKGPEKLWDKCFKWLSSDWLLL